MGKINKEFLINKLRATINNIKNDIKKLENVIELIKKSDRDDYTNEKLVNGLKAFLPTGSSAVRMIVLDIINLLRG
jgi:hypothetical protein